MPRIEDLSNAQRQAVLNFACFEYDSSPFVPLRDPLHRVKLALVTTAGLHCHGDRPFSPGDQSYRVVPAQTPDRDILQSHNSIGFDRTAIYRDLNVTFPRDRLRELVERGVVGSRTLNDSRLWARKQTRRGFDETGPEVAHILLEEGAGAAILTPT